MFNSHNPPLKDTSPAQNKLMSSPKDAAFATMNFIKNAFAFGLTFYINDWIARLGALSLLLEDSLWRPV